MIVGIGSDLVHVPRIERMLDEHGPRFAERILGKQEYVRFRELRNQGNYLAKRFAAKEATAKAFATGFRNGLSMRHIETLNGDNGEPRLHCHKVAAEILAQLQVERTHISLADDGEYALAYVILER